MSAEFDNPQAAHDAITAFIGESDDELWSWVAKHLKVEKINWKVTIVFRLSASPSSADAEMLFTLLKKYSYHYTGVVSSHDETNHPTAPALSAVTTPTESANVAMCGMPSFFNVVLTNETRYLRTRISSEHILAALAITAPIIHTVDYKHPDDVANHGILFINSCSDILFVGINSKLTLDLRYVRGWVPLIPELLDMIQNLGDMPGIKLAKIMDIIHPSLDSPIMRAIAERSKLLDDLAALKAERDAAKVEVAAFKAERDQTCAEKEHLLSLLSSIINTCYEK